MTITRKQLELDQFARFQKLYKRPSLQKLFEHPAGQLVEVLRLQTNDQSVLEWFMDWLCKLRVNISMFAVGGDGIYYFDLNGGKVDVWDIFLGNQTKHLNLGHETFYVQPIKPIPCQLLEKLKSTPLKLLQSVNGENSTQYFQYKEFLE